MDSIFESKLFKEYPKVAIVADNFGFSYEDIETLIGKIEVYNYCSPIYNNRTQMELALRAIIVRMDMSREDFFSYIELLSSTRHWSHDQTQKVKEYIGANQLNAYCAILN